MQKFQTLALAAFAFSLFACASPQPSLTPKLQLERVVVVPLNLAVTAPEQLRGQQDPVWNELIGFLQSENQRVSVLDRATATLVWENTRTEMAESDTPPKLDAALADFARRLAKEAPYDVIVIPSLVLRRAQVKGELANWDGVRRRLPVMAPVTYDSVDLGGFTVSQHGFRGSVTAASLHVVMLDSQGNTVFDGLGGLDVIEEADRNHRTGNRWSLALRKNPFDIPGHLQEGIGLAFDQHKTTRNALAW